MTLPFAVKLSILTTLFTLSMPTASQMSFEINELNFMSGCWQGTFGGGSGTIEEFYTTPSKNLMLGTTRYLRGGTAVQFEFTRIEKTDTGIFMTPYPGGRPSKDAFQLTRIEDGAAIFEAPQHDYPKRIIYRSNPDGTRTARIDGGAEDTKGQEWMMSAVPCGKQP